MLPRGAAHVRSARARAVCARLGIDCADAVVRFEFRRGASTPVVDGVVVPSAELAAIEDALRADQRISDEQARAAREKRAVRRWRQLLVALRVRAEIDASFAARSARPSGVTFPGNKPSLLN
ncbi:hypothetical protein IWW50_002650 [Coemansia erecta]|nr:hypothetical protein IWW50_002650 [Coemansia erecta]